MILTAENIVKQLESFESKPYLDSGGVPSIGYGSTYYLDGRRVKMSDSPISESDALHLMQTVIKRKWNVVKGSILVPLNDNQKASLASFVYNVGEGAFLDSTLLRVINNLGSETAITAEFRKWKYDNGRIIQGLINRREKEISLYFLEKKKVCPCCCS